MSRRGRRSKEKSGNMKKLIIILIVIILVGGGLLAYKFIKDINAMKNTGENEEPIVAVVKKLQIVDEESKSRPFAQPLPFAAYIPHIDKQSGCWEKEVK